MKAYSSAEEAFVEVTNLNTIDDMISVTNHIINKVFFFKHVIIFKCEGIKKQKALSILISNKLIKDN